MAKARRTYTDDERKTILAEWRASGKPLTHFGKDKDINPSVLNRWKKWEAGNVKQKKAKGNTRGWDKSHRYSEEVKTKAAQRYADGGNAVEIADAVGTSPSMIYQWARKLGIGPKAAKAGNGAARPEVHIKDAIIYITQAEKLVEADQKMKKRNSVLARLMLALESLGAK